MIGIMTILRLIITIMWDGKLPPQALNLVLCVLVKAGPGIGKPLGVGLANLIASPVTAGVVTAVAHMIVTHVCFGRSIKKISRYQPPTVGCIDICTIVEMFGCGIVSTGNE